MLIGGRYGEGGVKMGYYALKFLYTRILHSLWESQHFPNQKVLKSLSVVLSPGEVHEVIDVMLNIKHKTIIMFIYSTGVGITECTSMRIKDIDSPKGMAMPQAQARLPKSCTADRQVKIQEGRGHKQHYT